MRLVTSTTLASMQKCPEQIRNICILAHVDHGKTTLADSLVASNGIISQRLAGKLRYMDSRKDEQERGITMKSSAIALHYLFKEKDDYLINLIDSPGHVDFSTEVSTAVRLCDGALIVIDVVEGVCAQTIVSIRQAWQEEIKPTLILNKMDRLILEMKLTPIDAYVHLTQLLEKVNVVMAELLTSQVMQTDLKSGHRSRTTSKAEEDLKPDQVYDWSTGMDDVDDSDLYFLPERGNVVFASSIDGWGFRVLEFAKIFSKKVGVKEDILAKTLWGDYYLNNKLKRIMKGAQEKAKKPLFVQLVLENIWAMYETVAVRKDKMTTEKMVTTLNLNIHPRDLRQNDPKQLIYSIMSKWLPLSDSVLAMVCEKLPSPLQLSESRVERLMLTHNRKFSSLPPESQQLKKSFLECNSQNDAPVIVFVSKMFAVDAKSLPENRPKPLSHEEMLARREQARQKVAEKLAKLNLNEEVAELNLENKSAEKDNNDNSILKDDEIAEENGHRFIAFARVYSGTVRKDSKLYVLGPKHDPVTILERIKNGEDITAATSVKELGSGFHITEAIVKSVYLMMGRDLEVIDEVPAGNILGIGGLEEHVLRTATLSSTMFCSPFTDLNLIADPILRVAVEPRHTINMDALTKGLKLLNQADPCVQVLIQETGEHVLVTAGEVHLQRCLDDLRERFANVEITVSNPIVPFRETIVKPPKLDMVNEIIETQSAGQSTNKSSLKDEDVKSADGSIVQKTSNKKSMIKIRAKPLPTEVVCLLEKSQSLLKSLKDYQSYLASDKCSLLSDQLINDVEQFKTSLEKAFEDSGWDPSLVQKVWSFGPKRCGPNILVNNIDGYKRGCLGNQTAENCEIVKEDSRDAFSSNFINGFQMATSSGPLCEEPMVGVCYIVEDWVLEQVDSSENTNQPFGPYSGQIMSAAKEGCRKAFQCQPQRLMVAMYSCNIQVNSEVLGKLYAVLGKRSGRILHGDLTQGSTNFEVTAQLPVVESFDFANEVRRQTSGLALPQLVFSGWEILEIDPFWQPTTEEEYLHFGEKADTENRARKYMNAVRKRKGLRVEEKIVEFAEKQRTLTRNK